MTTKRTLMTPTASNIASMRELEDRKLTQNIKEEDDPWWDARGGRVLPKPPPVYSEAIVDSHRRSKSVGRGEQPPEPPKSRHSLMSMDDSQTDRIHKKTIPIPTNSRLLYQTKAYLASKEELRYKAELKEQSITSHSKHFPSTNSTHHISMSSDPLAAFNALPGTKQFKDVQSRLHNTTKSFEHATWKKDNNSISSPNSITAFSSTIKKNENNLVDTSFLNNPNDVSFTVNSKKIDSKQLELMVSRLSRPNTAAKYAQWKKDEPYSPSLGSYTNQRSIDGNFKEIKRKVKPEEVAHVARPTKATLNGKYERREEPVKHVTTARLSMDSNLLRLTTASVRGVYKRPERPKTPEPDMIHERSRLLIPTNNSLRSSISKEDVVKKIQQREAEKERELQGKPRWSRPTTPTSRPSSRPTTPSQSKTPLKSPSHSYSPPESPVNNHHTSTISIDSTSSTPLNIMNKTNNSHSPLHSKNNSKSNIPIPVTTFRQQYDAFQEEDFIQEDDGEDVDNGFEDIKTVKTVGAV
mmetsp:Transcript_35102/g.35738  ORF Transcript_35102/g.35738 Transcript_35102/m.35738 type:complete len:523 (+) Transcript_35102:161-1729(+)|eukprot:CAMPEP_0182421718 /NCGR_PEP_ID=MMETSP1167-20130531/7178_1 /TAXON_ID=2988 /ORGANISM="Mallomonas Sp, Strain CCMP3275" /LENGTH=522 /DNA_ID=CAMNT_0024599103 /DNA_START=39 /DNA_END=1607 /DNA_ORIENTATION=+